MTATVADDTDFDYPARTCPVPEGARSRRHLAVLAHLKEARTSTVSELAGVVADERAVPVDGQHRVEVALALHEEVLPDLAAAGLVDYEGVGAEVTVGFLSSAVADWLDRTVGPEQPAAEEPSAAD